jgi:hypothetical protein
MEIVTVYQDACISLNFCITYAFPPLKLLVTQRGALFFSVGFQGKGLAL